MNMYQAVNNGLRLALNKDPDAGNEVLKNFLALNTELFTEHIVIVNCYKKLQNITKLYQFANIKKLISLFYLIDNVL